MQVRALRGVCIGVERHLMPGDAAELDPATAQYLINIGACEEAKPEPAKPEPKAKAKPDVSSDSEAGAKPGKKE